MRALFLRSAAPLLLLASGLAAFLVGLVLLVAHLSGALSVVNSASFVSLGVCTAVGLLSYPVRRAVVKNMVSAAWDELSAALVILPDARLRSREVLSVYRRWSALSPPAREVLYVLVGDSGDRPLGELVDAAALVVRGVR